MPAKKSPAIHSDLESVLVTKAQINRRVKSLGRELKRIYGDKEITVVAIMNGAILFTADLLREIDNVVRLDCIRTTSYGNATESHGTPKPVHGLTLDVTDRHVLIVDDILDTGRTLHAIRLRLREEASALSVRICVLLRKAKVRSEDLDADYVGFDIGDEFVVGYGLDYREQYRNLPFIGVLKPGALTADAVCP